MPSHRLNHQPIPPAREPIPAQAGRWDAALLQHIAETYATPCYVYDLDAIATQYQRLQQALPEAAIRYAVKANACGAVLQQVAELGAGAEVITLGELERAKRAGIAPEAMLLGGPGQDPALVQRASAIGVGMVSIDSPAQWHYWQQAYQQGDIAHMPALLLRVNPGLNPQTHPHMATGAAASKFGMPVAQVQALAEEVQAQGWLAGFHVHAGSQIEALDVYQEIFAALAPLYDAFPQARWLDIGGGFIVPGFDLETFAGLLQDFAVPRALRCIIEPGRYLVAEAGVLLSKVLHVKMAEPVSSLEAPTMPSHIPNHVISDAGMADLLRPALYGASHPLWRLDTTNSETAIAPPTLLYDVDGPLCENADRLGQACALPPLRSGDILVIAQAGAYGLGMASNYASSLRPAEVVIRQGQAQLARQRERPEDLWRLECV